LFIRLGVCAPLVNHARFQSLGRDSVCSYRSPPRPARSWSPGFNPSVGILFVHTRGRLIVGYQFTAVSIPRSGFCLFIRKADGVWWQGARMFQSLGRDSVCSYQSNEPKGAKRCLFQSLGRDSVCSYLVGKCGTMLSEVFQSLGRDSVCSYLSAERAAAVVLPVSIPRSGFCLFIPGRGRQGAGRRVRFNPSVGILFVHTR